jgi:hypothetical protein
MSYVSDDNMRQFVFTPPDQFDPLRHAKFRGKALTQLDNLELLDALVQSLKEIRRLHQLMG